MFRMADKGHVWWPVKLTQAVAPGEVEEVEVWLKYRIFTRAELRERKRWATERMKATAPRNEARGQSPSQLVEMLEAASAIEDGDEAELLARVLDWHGFGQGEEEVPFSTERLQAMLAHQPLYRAFRQGLFQASNEAPSKNSSPGPGGTPERVQG